MQKQKKIEDLTYKVSDLQYELYGESEENRELQEKLTKQAEEIEDLTYRVSDRKILEGMYHDMKAQNEKLANNLKESQAELGESCAKSEALSALNTEKLTKLEKENEELKVKAATAIFNHKDCHRSELNVLNVLEEKCEYIELLENQKSELGHTLDQTKHNLALVLKGNEKLANDLRNSQAKLGESCAKN